MNLWECEPWGPRAVSRPTSPTMLLSPVVAPGTNQTLPDIWHHLDFSTYHHDQTLKWIKVGFLSWTLSWVDQTPRKNILCCYLLLLDIKACMEKKISHNILQWPEDLISEWASYISTWWNGLWHTQTISIHSSMVKWTKVLFHSYFLPLTDLKNHLI